MGIGGQSGAIGAGAGLFVTIVPASTLSLGLSPSSLTLSQGQATTGTVTIKSSSGPVENPQFALISGVPSGLSASLSAGQTPDSAFLNLSASWLVAPGTYTLNIAATSAGAAVNAPVTITISKGQSTYTISATPVSLSKGGSAQSSIAVASSTMYSGTISLTCALTTSPAGATNLPTCTPGSSVSLNADTASASTSVTVKTTAATTALVQPFAEPRKAPWKHAGGTLVVAGLFFVFGARSRRRFASLLTLAVLAIAGVGMCGCGGSAPSSAPISPTTPAANPGTTAGNYIFTVTARGNDAQSLTSSATFTVTVQ